MSFALDQWVACQFGDLTTSLQCIVIEKIVSTKLSTILSPWRTCASMWPYNLCWAEMNPCVGAILISINFSPVFFSVCRKMSRRGTGARKGSHGGSESRTRGHSATVSRRNVASPLGSLLLSCFLILSGGEGLTSYLTTTNPSWNLLCDSLCHICKALISWLLQYKSIQTPPKLMNSCNSLTQFQRCAYNARLSNPRLSSASESGWGNRG